MFTWEESDRAKLTPGCTVEYDGERREVLDACEAFDQNRGDSLGWVAVFAYDEDDEASDYEPLADIDPATLRAPTLATLNRMAVEAFGEGAKVYGVLDGTQEPEGVSVWRRAAHDDMRLMARFYDDAARECARWLAARGR